MKSYFLFPWGTYSYPQVLHRVMQPYISVRSTIQPNRELAFMTENKFSIRSANRSKWPPVTQLPEQTQTVAHGHLGREWSRFAGSLALDWIQCNRNLHLQLSVTPFPSCVLWLRILSCISTLLWGSTCLYGADFSSYLKQLNIWELFCQNSFGM